MQLSSLAGNFKFTIILYILCVAPYLCRVSFLQFVDCLWFVNSSFCVLLQNQLLLVLCCSLNYWTTVLSTSQVELWSAYILSFAYFASTFYFSLFIALFLARFNVSPFSFTANFSICRFAAVRVTWSLLSAWSVYYCLHSDYPLALEGDQILSLQHILWWRACFVIFVRFLPFLFASFIPAC